MVQIDADTTTEPEAVRLYVQGQLDLDAVGACGEALTWAARLGCPVEINLGKIDFIDGSGLSMLMDAKLRARRVGHRLTIVDASRCVCRLIEITDTADRLPPFSPSQESRRAKAEGEMTGAAPEAVGTPTFRS